MTEFVRVAKVQVSSHDRMQQSIEEACEPGRSSQQDAQLRIHDSSVAKWAADGHKSVIGHHSQEKVVQFCKNQEDRHLANTVCICNGLALSLYIYQHLWDSGGGKTDVHKGQVSKEEVHGCVQVRLCDDDHDDKQVPKHCYQVHGKEQYKNEELKVWVF